MIGTIQPGRGNRVPRSGLYLQAVGRIPAHPRGRQLSSCPSAAFGPPFFCRWRAVVARPRQLGLVTDKAIDYCHQRFGTLARLRNVAQMNDSYYAVFECS